jgi:hypothetical protein
VKAGYSNSDLWKYVMIKETRDDQRGSVARHIFAERFTLKEKIKLEELSERVNLERKVRGIL